MKLSKYAKKIESSGIEIHFQALNEEVSVQDQLDDKRTINNIIKKYNEGNESYWFCAKVWLSFDGIDSDPDYLGCCSYRSFDQFTGQNNDYFDDMLKTCYGYLRDEYERPRLVLPLISA